MNEQTNGAVAWRMRSGEGEWMLTASQQLAEELRALGWEVQALVVIPSGVLGTFNDQGEKA
jgi:hypothetical protein